ncbi:hypothetical protein ACFXPX_14155 [Kitasatospora sp. NPDC059146]|uniref:hypothetical protein n=1 Tax=Kitasatospora sp. NPDC059146 TaxID=3346741 RepID=UPI0036CD2074
MTLSGSAGRSGLVVGAVLLLAACSGGGGGGTAAPSATPTATATPYGTTLDQALAPIGGGLGKAAEAKTMPDLNIALATVETESSHAAKALKDAAAPAGAEAVRTDLVNALRSLSDEASAIRTDMRLDRLCGVSAGKARIGGGQGLSGVSGAVTKLTAAGHRSTFTVPDLPKLPAQPRTLENGTMVREGGGEGKGTLEVDNSGNKADVVFTIARNGASVASVFAAKGQRATIEGIADGSYDFYYTTGVDWDSEARQFTQDCSHVKFQQPHAFDSKGGGTIWTITVRPQDGKGNAKVDGQSADSAPQP